MSLCVGPRCFFSVFTLKLCVVVTKTLADLLQRPHLQFCVVVVVTNDTGRRQQIVVSTATSWPPYVAGRSLRG
jgi:hypothetical protein